VNDIIARRLTNLRKSKGLSQTELSEKIGISRQTISKWERGISLPAADNLTVLASFYEISADKIMSPEEDELSLGEGVKKTAAGAEKPAKTATKKSTESKETKKESTQTATQEAPINAGRAQTAEETKKQVYIEITEAAADKEEKKVKVEVSATETSKKPHKLLRFLGRIPFPIIIVAIYLALGFTKNMWHPAWILFLLIPIWESFIKAVEKRNFHEFAFPVLVTAVFLFMGFVWPQKFHPTWIIFLSIPIYYMLFDKD